jgi:hypothetical protein
MEPSEATLAESERTRGNAAACSTCTNPVPLQSLLGSMGNRATSRLAQRLSSARAAGDVRPPEAVVISDALAHAREHHPAAQQLLARALASIERDPSGLPSASLPIGRVMSRCSCGGVELPGGQCADCLGKRLSTQGMPELEVQRVVAARQVLARQTRVLARRSWRGCVNANLSGAGISSWVLVIIGGACAIVGAIGGILAAAPTAEGAAPATVPMGMLWAAAACVAGITGFAVSAVFTIMYQCMKDHDFQSEAASTALNDAQADSGDATATA